MCAIISGDLDVSVNNLFELDTSDPDSRYVFIKTDLEHNVEQATVERIKKTHLLFNKQLVYVLLIFVLFIEHIMLHFLNSVA